MKKWHVLFLSFLLVIFVSASGYAQEVGVAWVGKSGMANRVNQGLTDALKTLAPDVKLEHHKELASTDDLSALVDKWKGEKKAQVIIRSNGAKWLGKNPPTIPTFIGGCNHPGELGAVNNLDAPEGNITGVTYFLPVKTQFDIFTAILPDLKSVGLLLGAGNPSAEIDKAGTKETCSAMGIEYKEFSVNTVEEAMAAIEANKDGVSAFIIGNQGLVIDATAKLVEKAGNTPVLAYSSKPVNDGALGGFVADDVKLGQMLAESLVDVVVNGKAIKDVPVKVDPEPKFFVNAKTAQKLGIEIPYTILEAATIIE